MKTVKKKVQTVRSDYVQRMRDNYLLIMLTIMHDLVVSIDKDGMFNFVNDAAVEVLGYSKEELLNMGPADFDSALTAEQIIGLLQKVKAEGKMVFETTHTTKAGKTFPVEISTGPVNYNGKEAVLSIARDITERKKAEKAINETNQLLKQSNQELESYTYVVSHDLKAPLRTIKSFGSFILEDYKKIN